MDLNAGFIPTFKDIVLVGAGHAHVGVLRAFGMNPMAGVRLTLITREVDTPYSGMLPGLIAGQYTFDDVHIDTGPLAQFAGARLYQSEVTSVDLVNRRVLCKDRPPVPFDVLSINIGSTPGGAEIPGVMENAIPVKPIDRFLEHFEKVPDRIVAARGHARIGVVGGGPAGVELAFSLQSRMRQKIKASGGDENALKVKVLSATDTIVPSLPSGARARLTRIFAERGIEVVNNARVTSVSQKTVEFEGLEAIELDEVFWATQARPAGWVRDTSLEVDASGFIAVDDTLQSLSHAGVFAVGDIASMQGFDLPKSGVYAVRQGPLLAENL